MKNFTLRCINDLADWIDDWQLVWYGGCVVAGLVIGQAIVWAIS